MYIYIWGLTFVDYIRICALYCFIAEEQREVFLQSLNATTTSTPYLLSRMNIFDELMDCYRRTDIAKEYPLCISFVGEAAVDLGGVTREAFSCFWEAAYMKYFDGSHLLLPSIHAGVDFSGLSLLGCILSHGYLACGFLPVQIVFPVLASILLTPAVEIPDQYILEAFLEYITPHESSVIKQALQFIKDGFPSQLKSSLVMVLSRYGYRQMPEPSRFKQSLIEVARFNLLVQPAAIISQISSGVPTLHLAFWNDITLDDFCRLYLTLSANTQSVLKAITANEPNFDNANEERTFQYLCQYIESMSNEELRNFLRFVTGSSVLTSQGIKVNFNSLDGLARRPIAHTCDCTLELSMNYQTYLEFSNEFRGILLSDDPVAWIMDAL